MYEVLCGDCRLQCAKARGIDFYKPLAPSVLSESQTTYIPKSLIYLHKSRRFLSFPLIGFLLLVLE
jgi:hypothetical protein